MTNVYFPPRLLKSHVENRVSSLEKGRWGKLYGSFQNVFSTSCGESGGTKWRYFVAIGEKPHILGDIWWCGAGFSTKLVGSAVELSERGTLFHRHVGFPPIGSDVGYRRTIGTQRERWICASDKSYGARKTLGGKTEKALDKWERLWYTFLVYKQHGGH